MTPETKRRMEVCRLHSARWTAEEIAALAPFGCYNVSDIEAIIREEVLDDLPGGPDETPNCGRGLV